MTGTVTMPTIIVAVVGMEVTVVATVAFSNNESTASSVNVWIQILYHLRLNAKDFAHLSNFGEMDIAMTAITTVDVNTMVVTVVEKVQRKLNINIVKAARVSIQSKRASQ